MLLDVCSVFGEMNEDVAQQKKYATLIPLTSSIKESFHPLSRYAKWRAAHLHNCINTGEQPSEPAPKPEEGVLNDSENLEFGLPSSSTQPNHPVIPYLLNCHIV